MNRRYVFLIWLAWSILVTGVSGFAESIRFDWQDWETGDMNEQYPADSNGSATSSHIDEFYYRERIPMRVISFGDSLAEGSEQRVYDSAVLSLVVTASGLVDADSMRIFGKRMTRAWVENGASWNYHAAAPDSSWTVSGGDYNNLACTDTVIVDATTAVYDTLFFHLDTSFVRNMAEHVSYGWLMMAENIVDRGTFQVYTEDAAIDAYRPGLTVYFSAGTMPSACTDRRSRMIRSDGGSQ